MNMKLIMAMDKCDMNIKRLADLVVKSERTIKSYLYNERTPDKLTQGRINRVLKSDVYPNKVISNGNL